AEEGGVGDVVVADVVDLEAACAAVQQHVSGVAVEEAAEAGELPFGSDLTQLIVGQNCVVSDVVDLIETVGAVPQDHAGRGDGGRRRVGDRKYAPISEGFHALDVRGRELAEIAHE